jgi:hypothetical protein
MISSKQTGRLQFGPSGGSIRIPLEAADGAANFPWHSGVIAADERFSCERCFVQSHQPRAG